jgi:hypothetical protein
VSRIHPAAERSVSIGPLPRPSACLDHAHQWRQHSWHPRRRLLTASNVWTPSHQATAPTSSRTSLPALNAAVLCQVHTYTYHRRENAGRLTRSRPILVTRPGLQLCRLTTTVLIPSRCPARSGQLNSGVISHARHTVSPHTPTWPIIAANLWLRGPGTYALSMEFRPQSTRRSPIEPTWQDWGISLLALKEVINSFQYVHFNGRSLFCARELRASRFSVAVRLWIGILVPGVQNITRDLCGPCHCLLLCQCRAHAPGLDSPR